VIATGELRLVELGGRRPACRKLTKVPAMRLVYRTLESMLNNLAKPKSEILGFMSASSRMLLALRSRWMMVSLESSWR
jgi:hypothetical protein